jgi:hypothetical protein
VLLVEPPLVLPPDVEPPPEVDPPDVDPPDVDPPDVDPPDVDPPDVDPPEVDPPPLVELVVPVDWFFFTSALLSVDALVRVIVNVAIAAARQVPISTCFRFMASVGLSLISIISGYWQCQ